MSNVQESKTDTDQQVVDLVDDLARRMRENESVDLDAFVAEHSEHADALRKLFPALGLLAHLSVAEGDASVSAAGARPTAVDSSAPVEGVLGEFRILREIGRGGMGVVYEAEQLSLHRRVALKVLPFAAVMDPRQLQRFKNEAQAAASLDHPNIVHVHSVGCERGVHYYAMQYIEGRTLAQVVDELRQSNGVVPKDERAGDGADEATPVSQLTRDLAAGRLVPPDKKSSQDKPATNFAADTPPPSVADQDTHPQPRPQVSTDASIRSREFFRTVAHLGIQAAEALEHAHGLGVVHRDIKPSNLMVDAAGHLWITDFGLAMTRAETNLTMSGDVLGTLRYMSPEQAEGRHGVLDHHTDVYSLGVTLYELLTLRPAFPGDDRQKLLRDISEAEPRQPRQLNRAIPVDLETIVGKAMSKEPKARYTTAQELADDLNRFLADEPIRARRPSLAARAAKWSRRHRAVVWSAIAILLIAVAALAASTVLVAGAYEGERDQRQLVEEQKRLVEKQKKLADKQKELADKQKGLAEEQWKEAEQNLYLAHMRLAEQDWRQGHTRRLQELLHAHLPEPGLPDFRGWEWYFFLGQCHRDLRTLWGHHGWVYEVAWSPDGKQFASASNDHTVKIWNAATGKETRTLRGHHVQVYSVAWSPDGKRLASGGRYGRIRLWDVATGNLIHAIQHADGWVRSVAWSSDGDRFASVSWDSSGNTIKIWDAGTGRDILTLRGHAHTVVTVAWSPDGRQLASGCRGHTGIEVPTVKIWDAATGREIRTLTPVPGGRPSVVTWSPDGQQLAMAANDMHGTITIWDTGTWEHRLTLPGQTGPVLSLAWSPDGRRLASANADETAKIWDTASGQELLRFRGHTDSADSVAWSPDGKRLASASSDRSIKIWDARIEQVGRTLSGHRGQVWAVTWSAGGRYVAVHGVDIADDADEVRVWDAATGREVLPARAGARRFKPFAWSPKSPNGQSLIAICVGKTVQMEDAATGRHVLTLTGHEELVESVAWSPDGRRIATGARDQTIRIWDVATGRQMLTLSPKSGSVRCVMWAPDNRRVASLNGKMPHRLGARTLTVWNADTGERMLTTPFHARAQLRFRRLWSPDGQYLAADSYGREVLSTESWQSVGLGAPAAVGKGAWSPDGRLFAAPSYGDSRTLLVYDTTTWQVRFTLSGPAGVIWVEWSPDARRVATASGDGTIKLWDVDTGSEIATLREHQGAHRWVAWSPDSRQLASASDDGTVKIFDASAGYRFAGSTAYRVDRAYRLAAQSRYDDAIPIFQKLADEFPDVPDYRRALAHCLTAEGRYQQAIAVVDQLVADFPDGLDCRPDIVDQLAASDRRDEAIAILEGLLEKWSDVPDCRMALARAYRKRGYEHQTAGRMKEARADYERAIKADPEDARQYNLIAWFLATCPDARVRDPKLAVELANRAVELFPREGCYWNTLGVARYRAGELQEAIKALQKSVELRDGGDGYDRFFLAMAHWKLGNQDEARRWYDKAVEWTDANFPSDEGLRRFRAEAAELLGVVDTPPQETPPDEKPAEDPDDETQPGDGQPDEDEPEPPKNPEP